jgi:hypothetical protein
MVWTRKLTMNTPPAMSFHAATMFKLSGAPTLVVFGGAVLNSNDSKLKNISENSLESSYVLAGTDNASNTNTAPSASSSSTNTPTAAAVGPSDSATNNDNASQSSNSTKATFLQLATSICVSDTIYCLDLEQWKWHTPTIAPSPTGAPGARMRHALVATKTQLFVYGGVDASQQFCSSELYGIQLTGMTSNTHTHTHTHTIAQVKHHRLVNKRC